MALRDIRIGRTASHEHLRQQVRQELGTGPNHRRARRDSVNEALALLPPLLPQRHLSRLTTSEEVAAHINRRPCGGGQVCYIQC